MKDIVSKIADNPVLFMAGRSVLEAGFRNVRGAIKEVLDPAGTTLDLGCGTGAFSDLFTGEYLGLDLNERYIDYASKHRRGRYLRRDATDIGDIGPFSQILVFGLLHHLADEQAIAAIAEARRVLRPGGVALVIEDIPTVSKANVVGHLLHSLDGGSFIRTESEYATLYRHSFKIERSWTFRSGVCDYSACVLRP